MSIRREAKKNTYFIVRTVSQLLNLYIYYMASINLFDSDDDLNDLEVEAEEKVEIILSRLGEYVEKINTMLENCISIYRLGYYKKVSNFYFQIGELDVGCGSGRSNSLDFKIPLGVFFIYNINEISEETYNLSVNENLFMGNLDWMKSATDIWYNYKINMIDFMYGCTRNLCRRRDFSTLTRLAITWFLIEKNTELGLNINGLANHAFPFSGETVLINSIQLFESQIVLCKKLNFFVGYRENNPRFNEGYNKLTNPYLDSEKDGEIIEIQKNLYDAFLSTEEGEYYYRNHTRNSVGYNTFLMLGENVSLDTLPLLKRTIESIIQCSKKEMLISPDCSPYETKETTEEGERKEHAVVSPLPSYLKTVGPNTFGGERKKTKKKRGKKNKSRRKHTKKQEKKKL
jgi:hypothetical protein